MRNTSRCNENDATAAIVTIVEMCYDRILANLLLSGSAVCLCSKTEYRSSLGWKSDDRTNEHDQTKGIRQKMRFRPQNDTNRFWQTEAIIPELMHDTCDVIEHMRDA